MRRLVALLALLALFTAPALGGTTKYQLNQRGGVTTPIYYYLCDTVSDRGSITGMVEGERAYCKDTDRVYFYTGAAWQDESLGGVIKTSSESTANDTAFSDDAALTFPVAADTNYVFHFVVFWDTGATEDFKWQLTGPASPTLLRYARQAIVPSGTAWAGVDVQTAFSQSFSPTGSGTTGGYLEIYGLLQNGANAGNVTFQWAQNTTGGTNTTVLAGSYVTYATP